MAVLLAVIVCMDAGTSVSVALTTNSPRLVAKFPVIDPARGRALFVSKGCVICHSVNGVGGLAGPPLEADGPSSTVDIAAFAARMWRGVGPMVWLQTLELGYQVDLTGDDIAHLAGFRAGCRRAGPVHRAHVAGLCRESLLTELYRRPEDWLWEPELE